MTTIRNLPGLPRGCHHSNHRSTAAPARCLVPLLALLALATWQQPANAAMVNKEIIEFTGNIDAISFPYGGMMVNTGPITLSLDPTAQNVFGLDDSTGTGAIDVTLLVAFPLLDFLGEPEPIIRIVENGPASITPGAGSHDFIFDADLTGGGAIMDGLLAGVEFSNVNAYNGEGFFSSWEAISPPDITWEVMNGQVVFPATLTGEPNDFVVTGVGGTGTLTVVPEPGTFALGLIGVLSLMAFARRARRKRC